MADLNSRFFQGGIQARIGWGADMPERGVLSFVNETASALGARVGMTARQYVAL